MSDAKQEVEGMKRTLDYTTHTHTHNIQVNQIRSFGLEDSGPFFPLSLSLSLFIIIWSLLFILLLILVLLCVAAVVVVVVAVVCCVCLVSVTPLYPPASFDPLSLSLSPFVT